MNASQLFKAAHEMTRKVRRLGDDYRVTFAACLRALRKYIGSTVEVPDYAEILLGDKAVRLTDRRICNDAYFARVVANQRAHKAQIPTGYRNVTKAVPAPMPTVSELLSDWAHAQHAAHNARIQSTMTLGGRSL
jgi:hypothetical protein